MRIVVILSSGVTLYFFYFSYLVFVVFCDIYSFISFVFFPVCFFLVLHVYCLCVLYYLVLCVFPLILSMFYVFALYVYTYSGEGFLRTWPWRCKDSRGVAVDKTTL